MASTIKSGQHILLSIGNMVQPPTINTVNTHRDHNDDQTCHTDHRQKGHHWDNKNPLGHNRKHVTKPKTRIPEVKSCSECDSECSAISNFEEHLDEEDVPTPDSPKN